MLAFVAMASAQALSAQEAALSRAQTILPEVQFDRLDAREAFRWLFKTALIGGTVSPDVQGVVTLDLRNVTWETALQNVTRQVDATYRVRNGWFEVISRERNEPPPLPSFTGEPGPIDIAYDNLAKSVATGKGSELRRVLTSGFEARNATETKRGEAAIRTLVATIRSSPRFAVERTISQRAVPIPTEDVVVSYRRRDAPPIYFRDSWQEVTPGHWRLSAREETVLNPARRFHNTKLSDVLQVVGKDIGVRIDAGAYADRRVDVDLTGLSFEITLQGIVRQLGLTYRIEGGVYQIVPRE